MDRRRFIAMWVAAPAGVLAQSTKSAKLPRVGFLMAGDPVAGRHNLKAFHDRLRELNYIEGRNIAVEYRWAGGDMSRLPGLADELVKERIDVIVAGGSNSAVAAKRATSVIPIVAAGVADLADSGLVASLSQPEANLTGVAAAFPETAGKQLEIMRQVLGRPRRAAVLWAGSGAFYERQRKELEKAAGDLALTWHAPQTRAEMEPAFASFAKSRPDFLVVLSTPLLFTNRTEVVRLAARLRVPAIYGFREFAEDGGLISYGGSIPATFRGAAGYVDRILRGAKPAELPVQLPTTLELVVNLKAAQGLNLKIPQAVLTRADEIIR